MKILVLLSLTFFSQIIFAQESDFKSLCSSVLEKTPSNTNLCNGLHQKFFEKDKSKSFVVISPKDISAPEMPLDSKITFLAFNDPNYLSGVAYCYFVFKNWIGADMGPDQLGMSATGFSILNEDLKNYQAWLSSKVEGQRCKARVEKESEVSVSNLDTFLKDKVAVIGINPFASVQTPNSTVESVLKDLELTLNHERIHAYQAACPEFEKWSLAEWTKLPFKEKNEYIKKYPTYTWSIPKVAGREYIGYLLENNPSRVSELVKGCKF